MKPKINYDAYPFNRTDPVPTPYVFAFVRDQIWYAEGDYSIECPQCRQEGEACVSPELIEFDSIVREVITLCSHCETSVAFTWRRRRH